MSERRMWQGRCMNYDRAVRSWVYWSDRGRSSVTPAAVCTSIEALWDDAEVQGLSEAGLVRLHYRGAPTAIPGRIVIQPGEKWG